MAETTLPAESRTETGKRRNLRMRIAGKIPAVICERGKASVNVAVPRSALMHVLDGGAKLVDLALDGSPQKVLIREVQWDVLGDHVVHVDFQKVSLTEKVEVDVEVTLKGKPAGVAEESGSLLVHARTLRVLCLPTAIPSVLEADVSEMGLNEVLHASGVPLPEGVALASEPEVVVCAVVPPKTEEEVGVEAEVGGAAEPELIGKPETQEEPGGED